MDTAASIDTACLDAAAPIKLRRAHERGAGHHGWLESRHTFSFAGYADPEWMGFGALRVINDDRVEPGQGFATHGHRDMEIVSYVLDGALAHRDSEGSEGVLRPGDVQLMSAGRGVRHSEMNGSTSEPVRFLQIWIEPDARDTPPSYQARHFAPSDGLTLLVSPDAHDGSLRIRQRADIYRLNLPAGQSLDFEGRHSRTWIHVVSGPLRVGALTLDHDDSVGLEHHSPLSLCADASVEALLFNLR